MPIVVHFPSVTMKLEKHKRHVVRLLLLYRCLVFSPREKCFTERILSLSLNKQASLPLNHTPTNKPHQPLESTNKTQKQFTHIHHHHRNKIPKKKMVETTSLPQPVGRSHSQRLLSQSSHRTLFGCLWIAALFSLFVWQRSAVDTFSVFGRRSPPGRPIPRHRPAAFNLTDFGAVGDGVTVNTQAFERAISAAAKLAKAGGAQINVPPGRWLTAPFNLTSHLTLFLAEGAEILALQVYFFFFTRESIFSTDVCRFR